MSIYQGDVKLAGGFTAVDSSLSAVSTNPPQNKVVTNALENLGFDTWQKPASWVDIRSGAVGNSVYFLVGHSADYSTYPTFTVLAGISDSGTYDVFVDGIKQATTASATETVLTWQTLALASGFDVTYPSALRTHIVRVTPSSSSNTISSISGGGAVAQGVLWVHFTLANKVSLENFCGVSNSGASMNLLEAITAIGNKIKTGAISNAFRYIAHSLSYIPTLDGDGGFLSLQSGFRDTKIKKLVIKNAKLTEGSYFGPAVELESLDIDSPFPLCIMGLYNFPKLKEMPPIYCYNDTINHGYTSELIDILAGDVSLKPFMLDLTSFTNTKRLTIGGASSARIDGLKRLLVYSSAPFDGTSPQLDVSYTGLGRQALVDLFNSMPTVTDSQVCDITGATGANDLDATDLAIATNKGWTVTR